MKRFKKPIGIFLVIALLAAVIGYYVLQRGQVSTDDAAIESHVVTISPKIQGYVKAVNIEDNQLVKAGDVLIEIDPTDYIIRRDKAKATLAAAIAAEKASRDNLTTTSVTAPANTDSAQAQVDSAAATWEKNRQDLERMESLFQSGATSRQQLDQAIAAEKASRSDLAKAKASLTSAGTSATVIGAAQSTSEQLAAQVKQAESDLAQAESDLANTKVIASTDGRITNRSVEVGNYIQPGAQLASLVGTDLWIVANFKETQLEHMRPGQSVDIQVDAYPSFKIQGTVNSLQAGTGSHFSLFPAENATGNFVKTVQRVPVKIVFNDLPNDIYLGPGMSVIATVHTGGSPWP